LLGVLRRKPASITLIIICQVACMTLWFSATAAVPNLIDTGQITSERGSLLTGSVQIGFVFGTLISAFFGIADRFDPRRIFAASAILGSGINALILIVGFNDLWTISLRFFTGAIMAGIYPVGMKMAAGWAQKNMGLMIGALVGAVTLGSALPHLFTSLSDLDWRTVIGAASLCTLIGAGGILLIGLGPAHRKAGSFHPSDVVAMLSRRSILLANGGYLGHMWELYAMWTWVGAFLAWGLQQGGNTHVNLDPALLTFVVVASGALGCLIAGVLADRYGRTITTMTAMAISGGCAALIGLTPELGPWVMLTVAIIWGITVVADSAQFSAAIAELSEPALVGSMLTIQTCLGFLLTSIAIQLIPTLVGWFTWRYAFLFLSIGPFLGILSMWRLRHQPDAIRLANGRG
jgi:MFS family permease